MSTLATPAAQAAAQEDPFHIGWRMVHSVPVPLTFEDLLHPQEEDHVVNTGAHARDALYLHGALLDAVNGREDVEVTFDRRIDWGVPGVQPLGPDLAVLVGVSRPWPLELGTFKCGEVGARPALCVEVTSPATRDADLDNKVLLYQRAGVGVYAIVDYRGTEESFQAHVLGYRASPEGFVRLQPDEQGRLWLEPVRLWLAAEGDHVVCFDEQGNRVPNRRELRRSVRQAEARADELQQLAEDAITARQESEKRAADEARQREEAEKRAADLARRLAELEAELRRAAGEK